MKQKTKRKTRKMSILMKQLISLSFVCWLAIALIVGIITTQRRNDMVNMAIEEATAVATLLGDYISIEDLKAINAASGKTDEYDALQKQLNDTMNNGHIKYVYTLWTDGSTVYYGVDGDMENTQKYGSPFGSLSDYEDVFNGEIVSDDDYAEYDGEWLISAYIPLKSDNGAVEGVLACDFDANEVRAKVLQAWYFLVIYATMGTVLASVSLYMVVNGTVKKITLLNDKIDELVSSNGDLTKEINITSGDEMENLAQSINDLMRYIREVIMNISEGSRHVNAASNLMVNDLGAAQTAITDVSATMEEMSAGMEETSASLIEITHNVNSVYDEISTISQRASESAAYCDEVMQKASDVNASCSVAQEEAISKTNALAEHISQKIENSRRVEEIHELVDTILQISTQTNLLSLNASIEAARAGEAGRGFSVVASEIGKLASECKDSASRISEVSAYVITAVNELADDAAKMVEFSKQEISSNCESLKETSGDYKDDIAEINTIMQEFVRSCNELSNVMDNIKESINITNVAVEESAQGVTSTAQVMVTLATSSENLIAKANENSAVSGLLDDEVNKFKF